MEKEATSAVCQQISDLIDEVDPFAKSAWGVRLEADLKIGLRMALYGGGQIVVTRSANGKLDIKVGRNQKGGDFLVLAQKGNVPDKRVTSVIDELLDARGKKGSADTPSQKPWEMAYRDTPKTLSYERWKLLCCLKQDIPHNCAITLTKLKNFSEEDGVEDMARMIPERKTHRFALHPDNWAHTFHRLTLAAPTRLPSFKPLFIEMVPGTIVAEMQEVDNILQSNYTIMDEETVQPYKATMLPVESARVESYAEPELLIPSNAPTMPLATTSKRGARGFKAKQGSLSTDSQAFKSWFAGSKIVDAEGNPLVATHTSPTSWDTFDKSKTRSSAVLGQGIYLSLNDKTWNAAGNSVTLHLYVRCLDPLDLTKPVGADVLARMGAYLGRELNPDNGIPLISLERKAGSMAAAAEAMGFDGILHQGPGAHGLHLVVFQPNQIKSATDNSGAFDPNDDRITASLGFKAKLEALKPKLAQAAQEVYDDWDASDEVDGDFKVGFGGICHLIADAMIEVIDREIPGSVAVTLSHDSQVHVSVVAWDSEDEQAPEVELEDDEEPEEHYVDIYHVDIYPYQYETGGGYNWQKIPDVEFDASFVSVHADSVSPDDLEALREGY